MADDRLDEDMTDDGFDSKLGDDEQSDADAPSLEDDWSGGFYEGARDTSADESATAQEDDAESESEAGGQRRDFRQLFAGKNGLVALSLIPAVPALVVVVLIAIVFLKYTGSGGMSAKMMVLAGFALLVCAGITFMPIGIFLFGMGGSDEGTDGQEDLASTGSTSLETEFGAADDARQDEGFGGEGEFEAENAESLGGADEATFDEFEFNVDDFTEEPEN